MAANKCSLSVTGTLCTANMLAHVLELDAVAQVGVASIVLGIWKSQLQKHWGLYLAASVLSGILTKGHTQCEHCGYQQVVYMLRLVKATSEGV